MMMILFLLLLVMMRMMMIDDDDLPPVPSPPHLSPLHPLLPLPLLIHFLAFEKTVWGLRSGIIINVDLIDTSLNEYDS